MEPLAGKPVAVNGAAGAVEPVMVTAEVPVLVMLTLMVLLAPVGTVPKDSDDGVAPRPGLGAGAVQVERRRCRCRW